MSLKRYTMTTFCRLPVGIPILVPKTLFHTLADGVGKQGEPKETVKSLKKLVSGVLGASSIGSL